MAFQVSGKTALVTGGGSGICFEFTNLLLSKGCNVLIVDLQIQPEAAAVIEESKGAKVRAAFHKADVTDWAQLQLAFDTAISEFGRLDIVCPGAGIFEPEWSSFWRPASGVDTISTSSFKTLDINITHPIRATQLAIDSFKRQNLVSGAVILISSIAAQIPLLPYPLYSASKAAISSFVRSMGPLEQVMNIRVAAIAPGIVKTPIWSPEKLTMVDEEKGDAWVATKVIADRMLDLIQKEEYVGGTVLEVGTESVRSVEGLNDPGPNGKGLGVSAPGAAVEGTIKAIGEQFGK